LDVHERYVQRARQGDIDLLFLGDSITEFWTYPAGAAVWHEHYGKMKAAIFGVGGDRTQNLLWRLQHGELDGIQPKVAVLLIGINNLRAGDEPPQVAAGIKANVDEIRQRCPRTKILLL